MFRQVYTNLDKFRQIWTSLEQNEVKQWALNYITNKFERKKSEINEKKVQKTKKALFT